MKLQLFDGGAASRQEPQLLSMNQGVVYTNIDIAKGSLTPLKDKLATTIALAPYHTFYEAGDEWVDAEVKTDFVEFQRVLYLTDRVTRPQKYSDGVYNNLGIVRPEEAVSLSIDSEANTVENVTLEQKATGDLDPGTLNYLLYNISDGVYGNPLSVEANALAFTNIATAEQIAAIFAARSIFAAKTYTGDPRGIEFSNLRGPFNDEVRLYRRYDGAWRLLNVFTDKSQTFFDDVNDISANEALDTGLATPFFGTYQYVYTYYSSTDGTESAPSPVSAELEVESGIINVSNLEPSTDPQVTNIRLYRVGGNITEFTMVEEIAASATSYVDTRKDSDLDGRLLATDNYYEAPEGLKFLSESYAMLFGVIGSSLRFTPVGVPNAWPPEFELQFGSDITGLGAVANGLLVFTRYKTYIVTGTGPNTLAQQLLRGDQGCIAFESIQEADIGTLIWASADGLCTSSGNNVLSLTKDALGDITLDPVDSVVSDETYYCHNVDGTTLVWDYRFVARPYWLDLGVDSLVVALTTLYGYADGVLHELYKADTDLTFKYLSPRFVEGAITEIKTYKKVYIRSEGDIIIKLIINDVEVLSVALTDKDTHQLLVPQSKQRGYSMQFELEGTGSVQEIEYAAAGRQNV